LYLDAKRLIKEKKDKKPLADVMYNTGIYFRLISNYKKAGGYFDHALPIYQKLNDLVGIGNVNFRKGLICFCMGENRDALEMYDKALIFLEKVGNILSESTALHGKAKLLLKKAKPC
jgi:tetratricopeptide (TPR) repeat protein